jgi:hypothetical protein
MGASVGDSGSLYRELPLQRVHHDTLQPFVRARLAKGISPGTVNRDLAVVRRILNLSARLWRDASDRTWLETSPLIQMQRHPNKRRPYPLSIDEERLLFSELEGHLARMALFKVNTGRENRRWSTSELSDFSRPLSPGNPPKSPDSPVYSPVSVDPAEGAE